MESTTQSLGTSLGRPSANGSITAAPQTFNHKCKSYAYKFITQIVPWTIATYISKEFSLFLPIYQSKAGANTFYHAGWVYDPDVTYFDNTILTWGTDYALFLLMFLLGTSCLRATTSETPNPPASTSRLEDATQSKSLRIKSACLFYFYAISVLVGGYAHQTYLTIDGLNSTSYRILWTICVGSVTAAGGIMGSCGAEIYMRMNANQKDSSKIRFRLLYIDDVLWTIYGAFLTWICIRGDISYTRPACDIFVAGTSQFLPTVYCILVVLSIRWTDATPFMEGQLLLKPEPNGEPTNTQNSLQKSMLLTEKSDSVSMAHSIRRAARFMFYLGFALNAPLLPSYPCFVQYTSLSLGVVNAIMHANLTLAWGMQALSLRHFCRALNIVEVDAGEIKKDN